VSAAFTNRIQRFNSDNVEKNAAETANAWEETCEEQTQPDNHGEQQGKMMG